MKISNTSSSCQYQRKIPRGSVRLLVVLCLAIFLFKAFFELTPREYGVFSLIIVSLGVFLRFVLGQYFSVTATLIINEKGLKKKPWYVDGEIFPTLRWRDNLQVLHFAAVFHIVDKNNYKNTKFRISCKNWGIHDQQALIQHFEQLGYPVISLEKRTPPDQLEPAQMTEPVESTSADIPITSEPQALGKRPKAIIRLSLVGLFLLLIIVAFIHTHYATVYFGEKTIIALTCTSILIGVLTLHWLRGKQRSGSFRQRFGHALIAALFCMFLGATTMFIFPALTVRFGVAHSEIFHKTSRGWVLPENAEYHFNCRVMRDSTPAEMRLITYQLGDVIATKRKQACF